MSNTIGISRQFALYISKISFADLPDAVVHDFKRALLDYCSCVLSGSYEPIVRSMRESLLGHQDTAPLSFFESIARMSASDAAFVNGVRAHALDFDDGYTQGSCHPGAVIFSAAFAAAKKHNATPRQIITAVTAGYDVMLRISATAHPTSAKYGFHNTSAAGVFGAAAAAASILGLDATQSQHALGLAASFSGGVLEFLEEGADSKRLHAGKAARDGLLCAEMASRGITGPSMGLEGKFGFFNAFTRGEIRPQFLVDGLGEKFLISNCYFKLYPCCRHYHAAIDAACSLRIEHDFDIHQIERVDIGLYAIAVKGHDQKVVHNLLEAQMSAPCAVALALLDKNVSYPSFRPESLDRTDFKNLISKMNTVEDPLCEKLYPAVRSGIVKIHLSNGQILEKRVEDPKGEESNPLSDKEIEEKFVENSIHVISSDQTNLIKNEIWNFEKCDLNNFYKII